MNRRCLQIMIGVVCGLISFNHAKDSFSSGYVTSSNTFTGGGGVSSSIGYITSGTIGQTAIGIVGNGSYLSQAGFWNPTRTYVVGSNPSAPGAPLIAQVTTGNGSATVIFSPPTNNGGSPITGYTVSSIPPGGVDQNAGSTSLTHVITGLTNGIAYTFTVTATNSAGTSAASAASYGAMPGDVIPRIQLPQTGQTSCFDAAGTTIPCAGTGQDGASQKGVAWPATRFATPDSGNTLTDSITGLTWATDANLMMTRDPSFDADGTANDGMVNWQHALDYVKKLNDENYLGYNDWRLPNRHELSSLLNHGATASSTWLGTQGFSNIQGDYYWSSTPHASYPQNAWILNMLNGLGHSRVKTVSSFVWPVRDGGSKRLISLPATGQLKCYDAVGAAANCSGTGQDGNLQRGVPWNNARFVSSNNINTITDSLTGLNWAKDANLIVSRNPSFDTDATTNDGKVSWQHALDYVKKLNDENYLGYSDWRLPNRNELASLVNQGNDNTANWLGMHGFVNAQADAYWSSTTNASDTGAAFSINMHGGPVGSSSKIAMYNYLWPVRGDNASTTQLTYLPQTGAAACYNSAGEMRSCAGTGEDASTKSGVTAPSLRFTDNGNGTVIDDLTGLAWSKDANLMMTRDPSFDADATANDGMVTWQHALDYVKKLNDENYLGYSDWRLPNRNELLSLGNQGQVNLASWLNSKGFSNVKNGTYHSSTTYASNTSHAWAVNMGVGDVGNQGDKAISGYVWPVRDGGSTSLILLPATGQSNCYDSAGTQINCSGTDQDGNLQRGVPWRKTRFSINGDLTFTDSLTGLIWAKDANLMVTRDPSFDADVTANDGGVTWQHALDYVKKLNDENYLGYNDWRLPNSNELGSLVHQSYGQPSGWLTEQGFNVLNKHYWTSSTFAASPTNAWLVSLSTGYMSSYQANKTGNTAYVWPVRGGSGGSLASLVSLTVARTGTGTGSIVPDVADASWVTLPITANFAPGTAVVLTPTAATGSIFSGWTGCDSVSGNNCSVTMGASKKVTATFNTTSATDSTIDFSDFSNVSQSFQINGSAGLLGNPIPDSSGNYVLRLTNNTYQNSSVFLKDPILLGPDGSFRTSFSFQLSNPRGRSDLDGFGGDGFTFTLQGLGNSFVLSGTSGGSLGYQGLQNSVAVEFDAYNNRSWDNTDGNHVGIDVNGSMTSLVQKHVFVNQDGSINTVRLNDGTVWYAWVDYDGSILEVRISSSNSKPSAAYISYPVDLISLLGSRFAYVGFTAGTGSAVNDQDILSWTFTANGPITSSTPIAPVINQITTGNGTATVTFSTPVNNGGCAITGYTVSSIPTGGVDQNAGSSLLTHVITGLANGTSYAFTVTATNCVGIGSSSVPSDSGTPGNLPRIQLPQTGQTDCWDANGNLLASCTGTGQDGEIQSGVGWPEPRFTNPDGTTPVTSTIIVDTVTGLQWARDAGTPTYGACSGGLQSWQNALNYVACLNDDNYLGHNDWRLPNVNELGSLYNIQQAGSSDWLNSLGFSNVQPTYYWTSTTRGTSAWYMNAYDRYVESSPKTNQYLVLPVRTGSYNYIPKTGQTDCWDTNGNVISCIGTGQDGDWKVGVNWPNPRFTNLDLSLPISGSIIIDRLTGLEWLQDGSTPTVAGCSGGLLSWQGSLDYVKCLNTNNYLGHADWRLPNQKELSSLFNWQYPDLTSWLNSMGFSNIQSGIGSHYWTSDTYALNSSKAWYYAGSVGDKTTTTRPALPVRGGVIIPAAPTIISVTTQSGQATISFTPPVANGSTPITGYTVTAKPGNIASTGPGSPITVTGLTNGTQYTFYVAAANSSGTGKSARISALVTAVESINGACGTANGGTFTITPAENLCTTGSPSAVTAANGYWNWTCSGQYGGNPAGCSAFSGYLLSVTVAGTGSGSVHSSSATTVGVPGDISCMSGTCSARYSNGSIVNLTATTGSTSTFGGWGGTNACSGEPCNLTMNAAKSLSAIFTLVPMAKNMTLSKSYSSLVTALSEAAAGNEIRMLDTQLDGPFTLNTGVFLNGGWNASYSAKSSLPTVFNNDLIIQSGASTIQTLEVKGKLIIKGGSLRVDGVKVSH